MSLNLTGKNVCLEAVGISFSYGADPVLQNVSMRIDQGEFVGIAGPNGGGKTTLIKILVGLLKPQKGSVDFTCQDNECNGFVKCRPCIGYVPQQPLLREQTFPITVREVVEMGRFNQAGVLKGLNSKDKEEIDNAIKEARLTEIENELFSDLSGGQQQRALVARALVGKPHLLVLDEPTSSIDAKAKNDFYNLLNHLHKKHNMSVILILHDLPDLADRVNRLIFLHKKVLYDGPSRKLGAKGLWQLMINASRV